MRWRGARLAPADLAQERFILYSRKSGYGLSADIMAACRQHGLNPLIGQRAPQLSSAVNLVAAGMGVAIVPASLRHLRPDGVACRPFALDWPRAVGLALRENAGGRAANLLRLARERDGAAVQPR